jgi:hypothetical protein
MPSSFVLDVDNVVGQVGVAKSPKTFNKSFIPMYGCKVLALRTKCPCFGPFFRVTPCSGLAPFLTACPHRTHVPMMPSSVAYPVTEFANDWRDPANDWRSSPLLSCSVSLWTGVFRSCQWLDSLRDIRQSVSVHVVCVFLFACLLYYLGLHKGLLTAVHLWCCCRPCRSSR